MDDDGFTQLADGIYQLHGRIDGIERAAAHNQRQIIVVAWSIVALHVVFAWVGPIELIAPPQW